MAKILVVEDDKDLNAAYKLILEREGYDVQTAFNGDEALKCTGSFSADLILLDLLMPVKSGIDFLEAYDADSHPETKVVVFTNLENSPEINQALKLGAYKCLVKAWTAPRGLVKVVSDILSTR